MQVGVEVTDLLLTLPDGSILLLPQVPPSTAVRDELETWSLVLDGDEVGSDPNRNDPATWATALGAGSLALAVLQGVVGNAAWAAFPAAARYIRGLRTGRPALDTASTSERAVAALMSICVVPRDDVAVSSVVRDAAGSWRVEATVAGHRWTVQLDPVGAAVSATMLDP